MCVSRERKQEALIGGASLVGGIALEVIGSAALAADTGSLSVTFAILAFVFGLICLAVAGKYLKASCKKDEENEDVRLDQMGASSYGTFPSTTS